MTGGAVAFPKICILSFCKSTKKLTKITKTQSNDIIESFEKIEAHNEKF